jgi:hypothetical protein
MRRFGPLFIGGALALTGCDSKPVVREIAKPLETKPESLAFPRKDAPGASDPATRELVTKIIAAHTDNKPELLKKLTGVTITREGQFSVRDATITGVGLKQTWSGSWPGKARCTWIGMAPYPLTLRAIDQRAFQDAPPQSGLPPLPEKNYPEVVGDLSATWHQFLLPLVESDTIVAPGPDFTSSLQSLKGIRVWRTGFPQTIIFYDPKTMLVGRISYDGLTNSLSSHCEIALFDHKPINGFQIAERMYIRQNGREIMEFTKVEFELAKNHPSTLFNDP